MSKMKPENKSTINKYLREFVNCTMNKEYAAAKQNLSAALQETIKARALRVLQENS